MLPGSGNPGILEYQGVNTSTKEILFLDKVHLKMEQIISAVLNHCFML